MTDSLHLYVNGTQVFARNITGLLWRRHMEFIDSWSWNMADPSSFIFDKQLLEYRPAKLSVYVGSALCKFTVVDIPVELVNAQEQRSAAIAQMQYQLGINTSEWCFTLDVLNTPKKSIVCAIRRNFVDHIQELSKKNGIKLISLKPYVANIWNVFQRIESKNNASNKALIAVEDDAFTLFVQRSDIFESINTMTHRCELNLLDRELRRVAFSFGAIEQQNIFLALSDKSAGMAKGHNGNILQKKVYLNETYYVDFCDLLFCSDAVT